MIYKLMCVKSVEFNLEVCHEDPPHADVNKQYCMFPSTDALPETQDENAGFTSH